VHDRGRGRHLPIGHGLSEEVWRASEVSEASGCSRWVLGGLGGILALGLVGVLLVCCGCGAAWRPFFAFGLRSDLEDTRDALRRSDLPGQQRQDFIQRLEGIEDRYASGEYDPSFLEWVEVSGELEDILWDGRVERYERAELEEVFRRMER
jgi:hypothetical protein